MAGVDDPVVRDGVDVELVGSRDLREVRQASDGCVVDRRHDVEGECLVLGHRADVPQTGGHGIRALARRRRDQGEARRKLVSDLNLGGQAGTLVGQVEAVVDLATDRVRIRGDDGLAELEVDRDHESDLRGRCRLQPARQCGPGGYGGGVPGDARRVGRGHHIEGDDLGLACAERRVVDDEAKCAHGLQVSGRGGGPVVDAPSRAVGQSSALTHDLTTTRVDGRGVLDGDVSGQLHSGEEGLPLRESRFNGRSHRRVSDVGEDLVGDRLVEVCRAGVTQGDLPLGGAGG